MCSVIPCKFLTEYDHFLKYFRLFEWVAHTVDMVFIGRGVGEYFMIGLKT